MEYFPVAERLLGPLSSREAEFHLPQCWETKWEVAIRQWRSLCGVQRRMYLEHDGASH